MITSICAARDPEKTAAYYERMFGAEVIRSMQGGQPRIDMKIGGQDVFIAPVPPNSGVNPPPVTPYQGLDHFGLRVTGIEKVVADLKAKGAEFTMELNSPRPGHPDLLHPRAGGRVDRGAGTQAGVTMKRFARARCCSRWRQRPPSRPPPRRTIRTGRCG